MTTPEHNTRILLVEDDRNLGFLLKENLELKGYVTRLVKDGEEGWKAFCEEDYDLCIIDVMLPRKDGFTLAQDIRNIDTKVPIVFLTAKGMDEDKLTGFEIGADDYIIKPFSAQELMLRIRAILRRTNNYENPIPGDEVQEYNLGAYVFNYITRQLSLDGESKRISSKEAELLKLFAMHKNALLNRNLILLKVWGTDDYFAARSMDVYLTRLRKLLKSDPNLELQNVHGTGYKLTELVTK